MSLPDGLKVDEIAVGDGAVAVRGDTVAIEWRGWLNRGEEFGSGCESFRIGERRLIAGLELGVIGMRVGGTRELRVSPHLGYRDRGAPGLPSHAVLKFKVKLLEVQESD